MRGHMKEFQWLTTVMRVRVARMGLDMGRTRDHRILQVPAPSRVAASMSSCGICLKDWRSRNTA